MNCAYCDGTTDKWAGIEELATHISQCHGSSIYQCPYCFYRSIAAYNIIQHHGLYHAHQTLSVFVCNRPNTLLPYERREFGENQRKHVIPLKCTDCTATFFVLDTFMSHLSTHSGSFTNCQVCSLPCFRQDIAKHLLTHNIGLYQCVHCVYGTNALENIRMHMGTLHPNKLLNVCVRVQPTVPKNVTNHLSVEAPVLADIEPNVDENIFLKCPFTRDELNAKSTDLTSNSNVDMIKSTTQIRIALKASKNSEEKKAKQTIAHINPNINEHQELFGSEGMKIHTFRKGVSDANHTTEKLRTYPVNVVKMPIIIRADLPNKEPEFDVALPSPLALQRSKYMLPQLLNVYSLGQSQMQQPRPVRNEPIAIPIAIPMPISSSTSQLIEIPVIRSVTTLSKDDQGNSSLIEQQPMKMPIITSVATLSEEPDGVSAIGLKDQQSTVPQIFNVTVLSQVELSSESASHSAIQPLIEIPVIRSVETLRKEPKGVVNTAAEYAESNHPPKIYNVKILSQAELPSEPVENQLQPQPPISSSTIQSITKMPVISSVATLSKEAKGADVYSPQVLKQTTPQLTIPPFTHPTDVTVSSKNSQLEKLVALQTRLNQNITAICSPPTLLPAQSENSEVNALQTVRPPQLTDAEQDEIDYATENLYKCGFANCKVVSLNSKKFGQHLLLHRQSTCTPEIWPCGHCQQTCPNIFSLKIHIKLHGRRRFFCYFCCYKHSLSHFVVTHLKTLHQVMLLRVFPLNPSKLDLTNDLFVIGPEQATSVMLKQFLSRLKGLNQKLNERQKLSCGNDAENIPGYVPESNRYLCGVKECRFYSSDEINFYGHLKLMHGHKSNYKCPLCQWVVLPGKLSIFKIKHHLKLHGSKLYKCTACGFLSYNTSFMVKHLATKHRNAASMEVIRENERDPLALPERN